MFRRAAMVVSITVRHCQPVVKEPDVEFAFLQHAAGGPVVVGRGGIAA